MTEIGMLRETDGGRGGAGRALPEVLGADGTAVLHDGRRVRVVQLNNAATTPPLRRTMAAVTAFLETYGALHRGSGPRARATCERVEAAIESIRRFIGCDDAHGLLFTQNTSAAVNLLARMLRLGADDVVLTTDISHTSNNLPWSYNTPARVSEVASFDDGALDHDDLEAQVRRYGARVKVIAVTGASNQTGHVPDLARLGALAASSGALLFVDAAQLAPHRPIDMAALGIGALAFSAHKVYAPFGLGVLALPKALLASAPVDPGGGSIDMLGDGDVIWSRPAERHQTGTWNATGIVALGASCDALRDAGWEAIRAHEDALVRHAAEALRGVLGLVMYVGADRYLSEGRIGTFPFNFPGIHHALLAAALEHEHGVEVRSGTICNHRLVRRWWALDDAGQREVERRVRAGDRLASYGVVRASLGIHNTAADIDALVSGLRAIAVHGPRLRYAPDPAHETYEPIDRG